MQIVGFSVRLVLVGSVFAASAPRASAQVVPAQRFPMEVVADRGFLEGLELRLRPNDLAAFEGAHEMTMTDVLLPGGPAVDLELRRARYDTTAMNFYRDGQYVGDATILPPHTMWSGKVRGDDDSQVFLSFSTYGSRGWVMTQGRMVHLLASPGAENEWTKSTSRFIDESALAAQGARNERTCGNDRLTRGPRAQSAARPSTSQPLIQLGLQPPLECTIAIETDYQLFQKFANETGELVYLNQLLAAASEQYVEQINTYLTIIYIGYYTTPSDPWQTQDVPGTDMIALLGEFESEWPSVRPPVAVGAKLNHILSGANLGGGVAYLPGICNNPFNYAVSANLADDLTPFPVGQGPFNWDFIVFTHETGHNFGSDHTHEYCPPLDTCQANCNGGPVCMLGTIMSYCHLCPGGVSNLVPVFHQFCADIMRAESEGCLPIYSEGSAYCYGDGIDSLVTVVCPCSNFGQPGRGCANSNSTLGGAQLTSWGTVSPNTIVFTVTGVPNNTLCTFVRGTVNVPAGAAFGDGIRCYSGTTLRFGQQLSGQGGNPPNTAQAPGVTQTAGVTRYYQTQYRNPSAGFCPPALFNVSSGWSLTW